MTLVEILVKALAPVFEKWEREHARGQRLHALRKRKRWRKADVVRLLAIGVSPPAQRRMAELLKGEGPRGGPGVVPPPKRLPEEIVDQVKFLKRLWDPATPPNVRRRLYKRTPWWPRFIEAAYRGELNKARKARGDRSAPHEKPSVIAEQKVADAAGISPAEVHRICCELREAGRAWCRADPSHGISDDPEMTAAELKQHLENGPELREPPRLK